MKTLNDYLAESKKTYEFKVGVAGDLPDGFESKLKDFLEKYKVVSISKGKKTPIQERPLVFPNLENVEVTFWDIELTYPTTDLVLQDYLSRSCTIPNGHLIVRTRHSPLEEISDFKEKAVYEPLLTNDDMGGESAQDKVGDSRVMDLLKELEVARKEKSASSDFKIENNKQPHNNKSVIGN